MVLMTSKTSTVLGALGAVGSSQSLDILEEYMLDKQKPLALRQQAARRYASGWSGQNQMLELLADEELPDELIPAAAGAMATSWRAGIRKEAAKYLDLTEAQNAQELPSISELVALEGDPMTGIPVYEKLCQSCHVVNGDGIDFGPGLSEIGSKLSKEALYISILNPTAGVSFGYEGYLVTLNDGTQMTGLIQSRTSSEINVKQIGGAVTKYSADEVLSIEQLETSLMTPNLHLLMDQKELVDLVSYLDQLETPI